MLDLAQCAPQIRAMTRYIAAKHALDYGVLGLLWSPELVRQYNRRWLKRYAPGYTDIPGVGQECYCGDGECKGLCVIAGAERKDGERRIIQRCLRCEHGWSVPETVYRGSSQETNGIHVLDAPKRMKP